MSFKAPKVILKEAGACASAILALLVTSAFVMADERDVDALSKETFAGVKQAFSSDLSYDKALIEPLRGEKEVIATAEEDQHSG